MSMFCGCIRVREARSDNKRDDTMDLFLFQEDSEVTPVHRTQDEIRVEIDR